MIRKAMANFFDRLTENRGDTGNFFSELFGTTKPEAKRLREMLKGVASLPPSCIDARSATAAGDFQKWQSAVTNYTGPGRKESLHAVVKKITLEPPLRSDITHMRFSPDGKFIAGAGRFGNQCAHARAIRFLVSHQCSRS